MSSSTLHDAVLRWSNELLASGSLQSFAEVIGRPPAADERGRDGEPGVARRRTRVTPLARGRRSSATASTALHFVDALARVTPAYDSLHQPWSGAFHVADHGLLFEAARGITHLVMLPLPQDRAVTGVYNVGGRGGMPRACRSRADLARTPRGPGRRNDGASLSPCPTAADRRGRSAHGVEQPRIHARSPARGSGAQPAQRCAGDLPRGRPWMGCRRSTRPTGFQRATTYCASSSARIESQVRASDAAAHLGSDAFAILLPGTTPQQALPLAGRVLATVRAAPVHVAPGVSLPVTVSIGIAGTGTLTGDDRKAAANQWLAEAEAALHGAKRAGGDRWNTSRS